MRKLHRKLYFHGISLPQTTILGIRPFEINYKNVRLLRQHIGITGRILPRRFTGLSAKKQRFISKAIRRARTVSLIPFVWN
jgi:small subunit ribosomal protein S18